MPKRPGEFEITSQHALCA